MMAFNKNYQDTMPHLDSESEGPADRFKVFSFEYLVHNLIEFGGDQGETRVRQLAGWKLRSSENVLKALLKWHMD